MICFIILFVLAFAVLILGGGEPKDLNSDDDIKYSGGA